MLDIYTWRTPNGLKPIIFLEEAKIEYHLHAINISNNQQFAPEFLAISPNNKIPALVDGDLSMFESGAMLLYLSDKYQKLMPELEKEKAEVMQWLFWQVGGMGPMMGQFGHFRRLDQPYAVDRFGKEVERLLKVLDGWLSERKFISTAFSIADIMIYPWLKAATGDYLGLSLQKFPSVQRYFYNLSERESIKKSYEIADRL